MRAMSLRTWLLAGVGLAATAAIWLLVNTEVLAEEARLVVSDVGSATVITVAGVVALAAALSFKRDEPMRRYWLPIAVAVVASGLGDWVWTYYEVGRGLEPYPSLADALYVAQYPFIAFGLVSAALAYRGLVDVKRPLVIAAAFAVIAVVGVTLGLLLPYIVTDPEETLAVKILSSFYPLADVMLAAAPALFIVLVVARLGGGVLAYPWRMAAAGAMILAIADTLFAWQDWAGAYEAGGVVDVLWMLAFLAISVGASLAHDISLPRQARDSSRPREKPAAA